MTDAVILHSYRRCPFAIRVRMALEEKGIAYRTIEENLAELSPELLSLHPEGRVPLLIHETAGKRLVLYQSTVITEYLDEQFSGKALMPQDPALRAQIRLWTYWCDSIFKPDLDAFKYDLKRKDTPMPQEEAHALRTRLHEHLTHWNAALSDSYLVGNSLTLADIHLFPFARQFMAIEPKLEGVERYSNLISWLARMIARPAFEKVMAK